MSKTIQADSQIRWRYQLFLADGYLVEASADPQGDILQLGQGNMHPNIEAALLGLPEGENTRLIIMASEAFGTPDPDAVQTLPRDAFPPTLGLQQGQIISFALPSGQEVPGKILGMGEADVQVDFNHPLAGHNIRLDLEIVEIVGKPTMQAILANPRGFCAGVDRAIEIVDRALEVLGAPVYVRHEVVHNRFVVNNLRDKGAIFVQELDEIPDNATVIFSAHGVSRAVQEEAKRRGLNVFDATCPLVTKVHIEVARYSREGRETILIGHKNHPEVEGTMGQYDTSHGGTVYRVDSPQEVAELHVNNPEKLAFVTQTTLSVDDASLVIDALRSRFPAIIGPKKDDICYATQNRQDALKRLADDSDLILVVGSPNSSNSNRLREIAEKRGTPAHLIDGAEDIRAEWLSGKRSIGVTAGASAPEVLVEGVIAYLRAQGANVKVQDSGITENVSFVLPKELRHH